LYFFGVYFYNPENGVEPITTRNFKSRENLDYIIKNYHEQVVLLTTWSNVVMHTENRHFSRGSSLATKNN
jgi:hypothetical protein